MYICNSEFYVFLIFYFLIYLDDFIFKRLYIYVYIGRQSKRTSSGLKVTFKLRVNSIYIYFV